MTNRRMFHWVLHGTPAVVVRPWLWPTATRFLAWPPWRLGPWARFRYETVYGDTPGDPADLAPFLAWARASRRVAKESDR